MIDKERIDNEIRYGERLTFECKEAESVLPKSVWETYSSFANSSGGLILFGVKEHRRQTDPAMRFEIQGIKNGENCIVDFWNTINSDKVSTNVLLDEHVGLCDYDGKTIMYIEVPQATYRQKPIYLNDNPMKGTYKRNHEGDYHCTSEEVRMMLRDASDEGIDGILLETYTMDDIDLETFHAYRREFELLNPEHVWIKETDIDFMRNMGCIDKDRNSGKEWLTLAGLMMFGKGLPIRNRFENLRMDYLDMTHLIGDQRWSDRITYDGSWENNLYNFLKRMTPKLVSDIKRPFKLEGMIRVDDTPIHKAIREAVANMIVHADYHVSGGILKVIKRENCFEFSNPGTLKLPLDQIYRGGNSKARNQKIQAMLRMIGYGDNIGSGFPTILKAWSGESWRKPDLHEAPDLQQVELKLWTVSMMPEECTEYLQRLFGEVTYRHLSSQEQIILGTAYLEETVTNVRLRPLLELHPTDIGKLLSGLVEKKMLVSDLRGRWTSYRLNTDYESDEEQLNLDVEHVSPHLIETDQLIYDYISANGMITSSQVVNITRITTTQGANVALNRLIDKGMIQLVRRGRHVFYTLPGESAT